MNYFANLLPKPVALACAGAGLLLATAAQAQENNPYYLGATLRSTYNSNVTAEAVAKRDTINSAGLQAGLDQSLGRQRMVLNLSANNNRFNRYTQFDHTDYAATGQLDWETIENLSGTFSAGTRQSRLVDSSTPQSQLNLLRTHNVALQARLGEVTALTFEAGLAANQNRYSAQNYRQNDMNQLAMNAGVRFRPMGGVSFRTGLRHTEARYPHYFAGTDVAKRNDIELTADARVTGASSFNARLGLTREAHSAVQMRDYQSWTGALGWIWRPTGKLKLGLNVNRDSNVGAADYNLNLLSMSNNDSKLSNTLALTADWQLTSVISLNGGWSQTRRTLDNAFIAQQGALFSATGSSSAKDQSNTYTLGVRYEPMRNLELGCTLSVTERTSDESSLTYPYKQSQGGCYGQMQMR